jgi:hypothetical protein
MGEASGSQLVPEPSWFMGRFNEKEWLMGWFIGMSMFISMLSFSF